MIVVDTHAVIWLTQSEGLLSAPAREALVGGRREGKLAIADVTLREIAMQIVRGRIAVSSSVESYLHFIESLYIVLPINARIAAQSVHFGANYPNDPADRLIGATAVVHGARLVTKDVLIHDSKEVDCIW